jgi:hypothetical protein
MNVAGGGHCEAQHLSVRSTHGTTGSAGQSDRSAPHTTAASRQKRQRRSQAIGTLASVSQDRLDRERRCGVACCVEAQGAARTSRPRPLLPGSEERGHGRALTRRLKKRRLAPKKRRFAPVGQSASVERVICMWASPRVSGVAVRARGPVRRNEKPCHSRVSRARLVADAVRRLALRAIRVLSGARLQRPRRAASPPSSGMGGVSQWATASWPTRPSPVRCQRPVRRRADGGWCHRHS